MKTKEQIIKGLPKLTEKDLKNINLCFENYLFYRDNHKDGRRECECSACNKEFTVSFNARENAKLEALNRGHNDMGLCPMCGHVVQYKNKGKAKTRKNLYNWRHVIVFKKISEAEIYALCFWVEKEYSYSYRPRVSLSQFVGFYHLTPGKARQFDIGYYKKNPCERKKIGEPFYREQGWSDPEKWGYKYVNFAALESTFLKYAAKPTVLDCLNTSREMQYIALSCEYPSMERLVKIGLEQYVRGFLGGEPMKRYIDWTAETPGKMFNMSKRELADFKESDANKIALKIYMNLQRKYSFAEIMQMSKKIGSIVVLEELSEAEKKKPKTTDFGFKKTYCYLCQQARKANRNVLYMVGHWKDYLRFAAELKYDLARSDVYYPKELMPAHDAAFANLQFEKDMKQKASYKKRYEQLRKKYEYSDGKYQIVIPLGVGDIVLEGKNLSHCVASYANRHVDGKTTILFMRKCSEPEKRLVTIEVLQGTVRQKYGYKDRNTTDEENEFIEKWFAWVKNGSKKADRPKANIKKSA